MPKVAVIGSIKEKVARLVDENRRLRGDLAASNAVVEKLKTENREIRQQMAKLDKKIGKEELKSGLGRDDKAARARVGRLIREVDRCIALLK